MSYMSRQSNGMAPNGRADTSAYLDSSQRTWSLLVNLNSSLGPQKQRTHYQGPSDAGVYVESVAGGSKSGQQNPNVRAHFQNSYHANPNSSPPSNNHSWDRGSPAFNPQQTSNRYNMNSHLANGNLNEQSQQIPPSTNNHLQRRQSQHPRPQIRLPSTTTSVSNHKNQPPQQVNRDSDLKSRQPPLSTQVKSQPVSRRHRHSTSNSSKASTGSTGWSSTVNASSQSSLSSTSAWESKPQLPTPDHSSSLDTDSEWLLLRKETLDRPPPPARDIYAHIHPVVRKYAAITVPEVKMGEPRMATAVMSRRWQREETLERDKREWERKRAEGVPEEVRSTCFTEQEDRAHRLAMQTLEILQTDFPYYKHPTAKEEDIDTPPKTDERA